MNYLGRYLKKKLKEMKASEREISAKCGISHSYLNQLIKGINPSTKKTISPTLLTFEKLSEGLDVSVDFLQRVARGIINDEDAYIPESSKMSLHILDSGNVNLTKELIHEIQDFNAFLRKVGLDSKKRSEEEMTELISRLKKVIDSNIID